VTLTSSPPYFYLISYTWYNTSKHTFCRHCTLEVLNTVKYLLIYPYCRHRRFLSSWRRLWRRPSIFNISQRWPRDRILALKNTTK
jgi:hypothetical protein